MSGVAMLENMAALQNQEKLCLFHLSRNFSFSDLYLRGTFQHSGICNRSAWALLAIAYLCILKEGYYASKGP